MTLAARAPRPEAPLDRRRVITGLSQWLTDTPLLLLVFAVLAVGLFGSTWANPSSRVIGVGPDPPVFIWYLRWIPYAITHGLNPLTTNFLDYPAGINVMWQTSIPLLGLVLWPVTATVGPIVTYNVLMTASVAFSGWLASLAFRRHVARPWTAVAGGLVFAFSSYALAESLGHPHVGVTCLAPSMMIAVEEALIAQRRPPLLLGLGLGALAGVQLLISEELLLTELLMATMAAAILGGMYRHELARRAAYVSKVLAPAGLLFFSIAAVPLWFQFFGPQVVHGKLPASNVFVTDLTGFVLPTSLQAIAPHGLAVLTDRFAGSQYEAGAYLGLPLLVLLSLAVVRWRDRALVQVPGQLLILAATLSLGITVHAAGIPTGLPTGLLALALVPLMRLPAGRLTPLLFLLAWVGLAVLPTLDDVVPSRLTMYVFLFAGLLLAVFLDRMVDSGGGPGRATAIALGGLALLFLIPAAPFPSSPTVVPPLFVQGVGSPLAIGSSVLVIPYAHDFESRAMLWQTASDFRFRMPEGYANRPGPTLDPPTSTLGSTLIGMEYGAAAPEVTAAFRAQSLAQLRAWHVSTVIVGPMTREEQMVEFVATIIGAAPTRAGGVWLWQLPPA